MPHRVRIVAAILALWLPTRAMAQALTIATGDAVLGNRGSNLIANGSFENGYPAAVTPSGALGVYFAPPASGTWTPQVGYPPFVATTPASATPTSWNAAGSPWNYAIWGNTDDNGIVAGGIASAAIPDGTKALYFGNDSGWVSTGTPTYNANGTVAFSGGVPVNTNPSHANSAAAVVLSQTANTTVGQMYRLDFWASAEDAATNGVNQNYGRNGIFALQVGGATVYLTAPGGSVDPFGFGQSQRYYVDFTAVSATTQISFTNWGHFIRFNGVNEAKATTELVLDDVILNAIPEPGSLALAAGAGLAALCWRRRRMNPA